MTTDVYFPPGTVVQLKSGGPLLTAVQTLAGHTYVIYYNSVEGKYEQFSTHQECLKHGNMAPEAPRTAKALRNSSVTNPPKSSMSDD